LRAQFRNKAVAELHDVGLVEDGDFLAMAARGIAERIAGDARAGDFAGDLEAGDNPGDDFIFDAAVKAFGVLADDDHVDAFIARLDPRQIAHRPDGGVEIQLCRNCTLTDLNPLPTGVVTGPLEGDLVSFDGRDGFLGQDITHPLFDGRRPGQGRNPFDGKPAGVQYAAAGAGNFRTDPVAGN
jgi:hypothetical protein